jgi:hypothetical protein
MYCHWDLSDTHHFVFVATLYLGECCLLDHELMEQAQETCPHKHWE